MPDAGQPSPESGAEQACGPQFDAGGSIVRRAEWLVDPWPMAFWFSPAGKRQPNPSPTSWERTNAIGPKLICGHSPPPTTPKPILSLFRLKPPTEAEIDGRFGHYHGTMMQTPPVFSAIRVDGKRAYAEARAGRPPELAARPVHVHRIHRVGGLGRWWNWRSTARRVFMFGRSLVNWARSLVPGDIV